MTPSSHSELQYRIEGMDCAEEVFLLKRELVPLVGDEDRLGFDLLHGKLTVDTTGSSVSEQDILIAIDHTGLKAHTWEEDQSAVERPSFWNRHGRLLCTMTSGILGLAGLVLQFLGKSEAVEIPPTSKIFYALSILAALYLVLPSVWRSLRALRPDMNLLMFVAIIGAITINEWFEGATVAFLYSLSLLLESWSVSRARQAIAALLDLSPPAAHLKKEEGQIIDVHPDEVPVASRVVIRPGEKFPLDGRILTGSSSVDQAPITGESTPIEKHPGDEVFAGTINGDGLLEIETTKEARNTTLARIIEMVGSASSNRAESAKWIEKFASIYTPVVMLLALLTFILPPLVFDGIWAEWFYRALVLLVIACPCALVISTPVAVVAALSSSARNGVLVKGGNFIEVPATLEAIAMDKTGTLTRGTPQVVDLVPLNGHTDDELILLASALETHSNHPLARAIVNEAQHRGVKIPPVTQFETIQGKGATGVVEGQFYWVGSHRYLEQQGQESNEVHERLNALQAAGRSVVVLGNSDHVCGLIALADELRQESRASIAALRHAGIRHLVMLTGDNEGTAKAICKEAGLDECHAELLPHDKLEQIEILVSKYERVAMIGDGVNDAPALARSSLAIAMGAAGSDAAIETADIALMSDDLSKVPWLIHHSRRTIRTIRQNVIFSLAVKMLFVILTFVGFASLWAAIAADMGASLLVIFNGLRLLNSSRSGATATTS